MSLFDNFNQNPENNSAKSESNFGKPDNSSAAPVRDKQAIFADHIKLQAYEDGYIDRKEERALLEYAINHGIDMEQALAILTNVAQKQGYIVERMLEDQAKELLQRFSVSGGVIDKKEFNEVVASFLAASKNKFSEAEIKRRLKKIVQENRWNVKQGGLFASNWFNEIS